jgi:hypothetical protein
MLTFSSLGKLGRLGNQLWQIASTIGIAKRNNMRYEFPKWEYNKYFNNNIPEDRSTVSHQTILIDNQGTEYIEYNLNPYIDYDLCGYFQSYKYFEYYKDFIKNIFKLKPINMPINSCSIHIRRGDYLERSNFHTNLTLDYYKLAMEQLEKDTHYYVFSDDITWCIDNLSFIDNISFSAKENTEIDDLRFMTGCTHHIIANSSFSWWGAYLAHNYGATIAPKNWYVNLPSDDICPPDWIRI